MSSAAPAQFNDWIGRTQTCCEVIAPAPVNDFSATLDYPAPLALPGEALPACWHWLYFHAAAQGSLLDTDGHPRRGDFLPPVELPRRMWAGGRLRFHAPVLIGDELRRESRIAAIERKVGRSGDLLLLRVDHNIYRGTELLITEEQDIVYRGAAGVSKSADLPAPAVAAQWTRSLTPGATMLFRYSALTFNAHRIHYDRPYAVEREGYAGLVVQGPLTASLLLDLVRRRCPGLVVDHFTFRALAPAIDGETLTLQAEPTAHGVSLWALGGNGRLVMEAQIIGVTHQ